MSLEGKVAIVTGASRGIGKAIAQGLAAKGATVIGTATSEQGAAGISAYLKEAKATGQGLVLNVRDGDAVTSTVKQIITDFGAPAILVNNAGIAADNIFLRMKPEQWENVIDTNLNSVFRMTKACLKPMLKQRWGRIVNISSVVGVTGNPGQANYCAAKAGLIGFGKSLALEMASYGITVNAVAPGFIQTDMTKELTDERAKAILDKIPMGKMGEPDDIANAVVFLASEGARYITGQTLNVNGGMCMV